jgi:adenylate kinase
VLELKVDEEEITKRILKRGATSGRSDDLDVATIKKRVKEYEDKTSKVAGYYAQKGKHVAVQGIGSINDIFDSLCQETDNLIN